MDGYKCVILSHCLFEHAITSILHTRFLFIHIPNTYVDISVEKTSLTSRILSSVCLPIWAFLYMICFHNINAAVFKLNDLPLRF
jgi:hypothetical protein